MSTETSDALREARCTAVWNGCKCGRGPHEDDRHVWMNTLDAGRAVDPARYPAALRATDAPVAFEKP